MLDGPSPRWPELVEAAAERWFSLRPRLRLVVGLAVVVAVLLAAGRVGARSPWGSDMPVLVAARELPAGHTLAAGDLVPSVRPERAVPSSPLDVGARWIGSVATGRLPAGAVVVAGHLASGGLPALVESGRVAVAVPAALLPPLDPGRRVDLIGGDGQLGGQHVARNGRVLAADGEHVWIEVDRADAAAVSAAVSRGTVTVALLGR